MNKFSIIQNYFNKKSRRWESNPKESDLIHPPVRPNQSNLLLRDYQLSGKVIKLSKTGTPDIV